MGVPWFVATVDDCGEVKSKVFVVEVVVYDSGDIEPFKVDDSVVVVVMI
jgi:hypothetical protein